MAVLPFQPALGCVECRIYGKLFNQTVINHINYKFGIGTQATQADVANIAFFVDQAWGQSVVDFLSEDYVYVRTVATGLSIEQDWQVKASIGAGAGQIAQASLPGGNAVRMNYDSGVRGKSAHWGTQVAGIPKNNYDGNNVAVDWANSLRTAMATLLDCAAVPGTPIPVNLQRVLNKTRLASANALEVIGVTINSYNVGTQDTRMANHGQ